MNRFFGILAICAATLMVSSCSVIEGIFKAGVWSGIIFVVIILALIIWLISKFMGGGRTK